MMLKAWPIASRRPSRPTKPTAKSLLWVIVHSDVPSPGTMSGFPWRIRAIAVKGRSQLFTEQRHLRVAVGERRADDRDREAVLAVRPHQALLAGDLVPRVVPERVRERRVLANEPVAERLLVGARGADEDELVGPVAKEPQVALDVLGGVRDPVHHDVEPVAGQRSLGRRLVAQVGDERRRAACPVRIAAAIEEEEVRRRAPRPGACRRC